MAGPLLQRSGGSPAQRYKPMADINVTPMVDVMLVLLVVFMVTAPLLTVGVPVDLPQTQAQQLNEPKEPLVITINYGRILEVMGLVSSAGFNKVSLIAELPTASKPKPK